ncbi:PCI domain-containing protein [Aphelenchoides fujianensis]|nr:PCI domain-containing protein [Aphelenchoides fujianensis]
MATGDAERVRAVLADASVFTVDPLLQPAAIKQLEKDDPQLHRLLTVFSTGNLRDFRQFVQENPAFIREELKAEEGVMEKKMKMLSLISLAEQQTTIPLQTLAAELDIAGEEPLEEFLIDALQCKAINGKIDQVNNQFVVTGFEHRVFGRPQWELLQGRLTALLRNIKRSHANLDKLVAGEPIDA